MSGVCVCVCACVYACSCSSQSVGRGNFFDASTSSCSSIRPTTRCQRTSSSLPENAFTWIAGQFARCVLVLYHTEFTRSHVEARVGSRLFDRFWRGYHLANFSRPSTWIWWGEEKEWEEKGEEGREEWRRRERKEREGMLMESGRERTGGAENGNG